MSNEEITLLSLEYVNEGLPLPVDVATEFTNRGLMTGEGFTDPYTSEATINSDDFQMEI